LAEPHRVQGLDAARGIAMLFVCVSHFGFSYFRGMPGHALEASVIMRLGMIASPTFVLLSGLLLGFLHRTRPADMPALRAKLIDRALFMLIVGHILLQLADPHVEGGGHIVRWAFITDVIALGLLVGPLLIDRVRPGQRLVVASALYAFGWIGLSVWHPEAMTTRIVKECFFGPEAARNLPGTFPVLPWLAVYIAATVLGEHLGTLCAVGRLGEMRLTLTRLALVCFLVALGLRILPFVLKAIGVGTTSGILWALGWPFQKLPPSPAYLGFYTGLGLLMIRGLLAADEHPTLHRWLRIPSALGRASLVAFIAQAFVYFTVLRWWDPAYSPLWPLVLIVSLTIVLGIGLLWERLGSNDALTVGYRFMPLLTRRVAASPATR
jgi:uncharacterized membrane protein